MILLAAGGMGGLLIGRSASWLRALMMVVTEGGLAGLIIIAAGGWGYPIVRKLAPPDAPRALVVATACGLGLWLLGTAVLVVGSAFTGALRPWVWWPVIAGGVILAAWQGRKAMESWQLPMRFDARAMVWIILGAAAGIWLAGATRPPGLMVTADTYDVLEYHLQVPREFFNQQHIGELQHNCYSYYPLGVEMLFLLAMCMRNGAYEGMYLAKILHGAFAVLAVAAIYGALKRDDESRGRFAAILLGTIPMLIYLSWLAMVELAVVFYTVLAVLWLRQWLLKCQWGSAACVGIAVGAACAVKYLSVGLVAGPVILAMIVMSFRSGRWIERLAHVQLVALGCLVLFSPWLIRNLATTGNPVFPLATETFGRGHWTAESQQRWQDGHGPDLLPPVPQPPPWQAGYAPGRLELFYDNLVTAQQLSPMVLLLAGVGICVLIAAGKSAAPWDLSLAIILAGQIGVWIAFTHQMPTRFLAPAVVPVCLLAGWVLSMVAGLRANPLRRHSGQPERAGWGRPASIALLCAALGANLMIGYRMYRRMAESYDQYAEVHAMPAGISGLSMSKRFSLDPAIALPADAQFMLIGEVRGWYWPDDTIYATAFDTHPLAAMIDRGDSPEQILADLRSRGVTHIVVSWYEIWRLASSYGYHASLSAELFDQWQAGGQPDLGVLRQLLPLGVRKVADVDAFYATLRWDTEKRRLQWPLMTIYAMPWAPVTARPAASPAPAPAADGAATGS